MFLFLQERGRGKAKRRGGKEKTRRGRTKEGGGREEKAGGDKVSMVRLNSDSEIIGICTVLVQTSLIKSVKYILKLDDIW